MKKILPVVFLAAGVTFLVLAFGFLNRPGNLEMRSRRLGHIIDKRVSLLEKKVDQAFSNPTSRWLEGLDLPEDMVIYRYVGDSLQAWANQFPVADDELSSFSAIPRMTGPKASKRSLIAVLDTIPRYINMGPKWYVAFTCERGPVRVVAGLEIINTLTGGSSGWTNRDLHLRDQFSIEPLSSSSGCAVFLRGEPLLKLVNSRLGTRATADPPMLWMALLLVIVAAFLYVYFNRTLKSFEIASVGLLSLLFAVHVWGRSVGGVIPLFSPELFADSSLFWSFGDVLLANLTFVLLVSGLFLIRRDLYSRLHSRRQKNWFRALMILAALGLMLYLHFSLCSLVRNSSISLELYKLGELSRYSLLVYFSYITLLLMILLLLQMSGRRDMLSTRSCVIFSVLIGGYLTLVTSTLGFRKEEDSLAVLANRLSIERDIAVEIRLKMVENQIADDAVVATLLQIDGTEPTVRSRLMDVYFPWLSPSYGVSVAVLRDSDHSSRTATWFNSRVKDSESVSGGSRFMFSVSNNGIVRYTGIFMYMIPQMGMTRLVVCIDPVTDRNSKGYFSLLEESLPGQVNIPSHYSYAKYRGRDLQLFRGDFAYATKLPQDLYDKIVKDKPSHLNRDSFTHFPTLIEDDELVVISRPKIGVDDYLVAFLFVSLQAFVLLSLMRRRKDAGERFGKHYYRTRITSVMIFFLVMTLVVMASVSILFVFRRNNSNLHTMMSTQVSMLQSQVEYRLKDVNSLSEIDNRELLAMLQRIGNYTKTDITLYTLDGKVYLSTAAGMYDNMVLGSRIDETAFREITANNKRYFIQEEKIAGIRYQNMYAPVRGADGSIVSILGTPYADRNYDFEMDAIMHSMTILVVFFILLIMARLTSVTVVSKMFRPLLEMGSKMASANLDSLEHIAYERDDEISGLVQSYNRMVTELSESTRQLAQAERDKAWSGMARQVAHEIKNPLTPMKLQIQRVIRLKQKGDPQWENRFDEVSKVLLDHIDILTDTANEFSTFAKLYTEEYTTFDVDHLLQEEIMMFDNKGPVRFDYFGLEGAMISAPKPQLTRVFVNLLNNAVQAVGEDGGRVLVFLRNSTREGFYDIVFEDNGPGVGEENESKLFTPNFTTKSAGSGLGLAISRNILERCGAQISYSRSFSLGGACFTIVYPKLNS